MTELLESGYLSTDDPVVAACFLGRMVYWDETLEDEWDYRLEAVAKERCDVFADGDPDFITYPILIPAKVVAEKMDEDPLVWFVIVDRLPGQAITDGSRTIDTWLRSHAQGE